MDKIVPDDKKTELIFRPQWFMFVETFHFHPLSLPRCSWNEWPGVPVEQGVIMKQLFFAVFLCAFFALVGYAATRAGIPPFNKMMEIMGENGVTILFAVTGLIVGFWLGNR
jgi:hypothetical protein